VRNGVESDRIHGVIRVSRAAPGYVDLRNGFALPVDVGTAGTVLWRFGRNLRLEIATLPTAPPLVDQRADAFGIDVASDDDGGVFGAVVAGEKLATVGIAFGHGLHIFEEAHCGVAIGVDFETG